METFGNAGNVAKHGQELADKAADKIQSGIKTVKDGGLQAADRVSDKLDSVRSSAGPAIARAADHAGSIFGQTIDSLSAAGKRARSGVADVGDRVVTYAKDNPVQAILISAAAGALIAALVRALMPARD